MCDQYRLSCEPLPGALRLSRVRSVKRHLSLSFSAPSRQQADEVFSHHHSAACDGNTVAPFIRCLLNSEPLTVLTFKVFEHKLCTDRSRCLSFEFAG